MYKVKRRKVKIDVITSRAGGWTLEHQFMVGSRLMFSMDDARKAEAVERLLLASGTVVVKRIVDVDGNELR